MHADQTIEQGQRLDKASNALILLHGRGGAASDLLPIAQECCDESFYIAAPQAANNSWYPFSFMAEENSNEPWLSSSIERIKKIVDDTARHIPTDRIYLMGFSQGACLALEFSARHAAKYGGIAAFTGGLIGHALNVKKYNGRFEGTKIFIGNSDKDPHVPLSRSEQSKAILEKMGADVTLKIYPGMGHTITNDEIAWVKNNIMPA